MTKKERERFSDVMTLLEGIPLSLSILDNRYKAVRRTLATIEREEVGMCLKGIEKTVRMVTSIVYEMNHESTMRNKEEGKRYKRK